MKKVVVKATAKKDADLKDAKKDLKSKVTKAAKAATERVTAVVDKISKTVDPNAANEQGKTEETEEEKLARNPRLRLPALLYEFRANVNTIDLVGRVLWHHTDKKESIETARELFQRAELAFPDRIYVKLLRVTFLTSTTADPSAHLAKLDAIMKLEPSLATRYFVFKRKIEVKLLAARTTSEDKNAVELVNYVEFQKYFAETQVYNNRAIQVSHRLSK